MRFKRLGSLVEDILNVSTPAEQPRADMFLDTKVLAPGVRKETGMKKIILFSLILVSLIVLLCACGKAENLPTGDDTALEMPETPGENTEAEIVSVQILNEPKRTNYYHGESLDPAGMTLQVTYDDGTKQTVTEGFACVPHAFNGGKENATENVTVQVSYKDLLAGEFTVSVVDGVELVSSDFLDDKTENRTELLTDASYYVVFGAKEYTEETLTLPSFYEGVAVKSLYHLENDNVRKIVLDEGFEILPARAFQYCEMLKELVIPASVSKIEHNAVVDCPNLQILTVDTDSTYFVSDERGVVYSKDMTVLVMGPKWLTGSGTFTVPEGVTEIAPAAFSNVAGISTLILPKSLKTIGEYAFSKSKGLGIVVIPESVESIGSMAFAFTKGDFPDEVHCQAQKKPNGWASDWTTSIVATYVRWNSRYVDWDTLTLK